MQAYACTRDEQVYNEYNEYMKERYGELAKDILMGLVIAGAVAVAATSPYFLLNLAKQILRNQKYFEKEWEKIKFKRALEKLKKNRLVILREKEGKFTVELTEKGKRKTKEIQLDGLKVEKPQTWDGKWRIVIFDIPNRFGRARDALREKLKDLGFYQFQKSAWIIPYPCEKEIEFLAEFFDIYSYLNIVETERISNDLRLKRHFRLL